MEEYPISLVHPFSKFLTLFYFRGQLYYSVYTLEAHFWHTPWPSVLIPQPHPQVIRGKYPWGKMMQWKKHELGDKRDLALNFQIYSLLVDYDLGQRINPLGLLWWLNGKETAWQCMRHGFDLWSGKISHATEQLSSCNHSYWACALEPRSCNYWAHTT